LSPAALTIDQITMALGKSKIIVFGAAVEIVNVPFATVIRA
jgi:hypothetical protein